MKKIYFDTQKIMHSLEFYNKIKSEKQRAEVYTLLVLPLYEHDDLSDLIEEFFWNKGYYEQ